MINFQESLLHLASNPLLIAGLFVLLLIIIIVTYVACLCSSLKGKLDFVYDQETGQPLNAVHIKGCCCCGSRKTVE